VRAQVAKDMAQRFIESPLTAEGMTSTLREPCMEGGFAPTRPRLKRLWTRRRSDTIKLERTEGGRRECYAPGRG